MTTTDARKRNAEKAGVPAPVADTETRAAEVLAEHDWFTPRGYAWPCCGCGAEFADESEARLHQVAALAAAGVLATPAPAGLTNAERHVMRRIDDRLRIQLASSATNTLRIDDGDWTTAEGYVERMLAARSTPAPDTAAVEALARLTSDLRAVVAKVDRSWGGAAMVVRDSVAHLLGDRCTNEFCEHDHVAIRAALAPRATTEGSETDG